MSRCWTYETAVILDQEISNNIPYNDFFQYYGPDYCLQLTPSEMHNKNDREFLDGIKTTIFQQLSALDHAPSVQMHEVPPDLFDHEVYDARREAEVDPDVRVPEKDQDRLVQPANEFFDDDMDADGSSIAKLSVDIKTRGV